MSALGHRSTGTTIEKGIATDCCYDVLHLHGIPVSAVRAAVKRTYIDTRLDPQPKLYLGFRNLIHP